MRFRSSICAILLASAHPAGAEPIGRWFSGYGQGTLEYGIKNDSAGSDYFYIACSPDFGTSIRITVGAQDAKPGSTTIVVIGGDEFELWTDKDGVFRTDSHVAYDTFRSLWDAMRRGTVMRVRLSSGQSTVFTLRGAAIELPRAHCETDFER